MVQGKVGARENTPSGKGKRLSSISCVALLPETQCTSLLETQDMYS